MTIRTGNRACRIQGAFTLCAGGLAVLGLLSAGIPAGAAGDGDVSVGGEHILTVRFPSGGMSVTERADAITERLVTILSDPDLKPADIVAVSLGKNAAKILVKNRLLVTVDLQTARYNQTSPLALAQSWTTHLRKVLPQINVKPNPNNGEPPADGGKSV